MENDEALVLLAAACHSQIEILKRFVAILQRFRENEALRQENAQLRQRVQQLEGGAR